MICDWTQLVSCADINYHIIARLIAASFIPIRLTCFSNRSRFNFDPARSLARDSSE